VVAFSAPPYSGAVTSVNDAPASTAGPNQTIASSAGAQTVAGWATGFSPGPDDEASQTLLGYSIVSNTNSELFSIAPTIDAFGTLTYTPKPGASGTATISVVVRDSGSTANGGVDTSTVRTFTITVSGSYKIYLPMSLRAP
jgi:large repetitive protein